MGRALVFEVHSAVARRKTLMVKFMGPTAHMIVGGVKQDFLKKHSPQTLNPRPLNLNPKPGTANPKA